MVNAVSNASYAPSASTSNLAQSALQALLNPPQSSQSGSAVTATSQASSTNNANQIAQNLFSQIDTSGKGSITQAGLAQAVTQAGGTKQAADSLWAKLSPTNTSSINKQQFIQNLPKLPKPQGPPQAAQISNPYLNYSGDVSGSSAASGTSTTYKILQYASGVCASSGNSVLNIVA